MVNGFVHSYIGITPDFGSEKRGSTPRWTTRAASAALIVEVRTTIKQKQPFPQKRSECDGILGIK